MSFLFGSSKVPSFQQPPAPKPSVTPAPPPSVEELEETEKKKLTGTGTTKEKQRSTILTSPRGILTAPKVGKKRLLGG